MSVGSDDSARRSAGDGFNADSEEPLPRWIVTTPPEGAAQSEIPHLEDDAGAGTAGYDESRGEPSLALTAALDDQHYVDANGYGPTGYEEPPRRTRGFWPLGFLAALISAAALLVLGAVGYAFLTEDDGNETAQAVAGPATASDTAVENVSLLLQGVGYEEVAVEERDGTIFLSGEVETQADLAAIVTASASQADGFPINTDGMTIVPTQPNETTELTVPALSDPASGADPLQQLQVALNRTVAATPIIFEPGTSGIAAWHTGILDRVADLLLANPGIAVSVVGYTDDSGPSEGNQAISDERAGAVTDYLVSRGVEPGLLKTVARGESQATGLRDIGYLERRVEFEVVAVALTPPAALPLNVGVIVPSPRDDLAFSQSLIDALEVLNGERGGLTLNISDNMFDVDLARQQAEQYVAGGSDVVILHGAQYVPLVTPLAQANPDVVFVVGPNPVETDLPNVFVYTIAAEQGAYVLGDLAASLSGNKTIGIVGPVPASEPQRFIEGFRLGAELRGAQVFSEYTGSFNDVEAATAVAQQQVDAGADVLTGTSQMTVGPIALAEEQGLLWFANQANQQSLARQNVVASQVYHFEVAIREILAEIDADATSGGTFPLTLGNGGMLLEFNPDYALDPELRKRADNLLLQVTAGSITIDVQLDG